MNPWQVPAGTMVVGVDGSTSSETALTWGIEQAALERRPLTIVHSVRPQEFPGADGMYATTGIDYGQLMDDLRSSGRALLAAAAAQAVQHDNGLTVHQVLDSADPRTTLLDLSKDAAMVVVGSRGRGPEASLLLGSVSVAVLKHAACPVVVLRPMPTDRHRAGVLVDVDGSDRSQPAVEFAYRMASWRSLPLTVLHCFWEATPVAPLPDGADMTPSSAEQAVVAESLAGMQEKFPEVSVTVRLVRGFADQHLINASRNYDLVVVGHRPLSVLDDFVYGSVALTVVEHASGAVAVVPSPVPVVGPTVG